MLKRDKGTNLFATNKPPAQLFSPRGRRKVAHSELFSYLCATQAPGRGAARAHSSVGQSSGLIIRRSWDHAPLGPPDKPEHPSRRMPRLLFCPAGKGLPSVRSAPSTRQEFPPSAQQARTTRPPGIPPFRTTRPLETPPRPHDTPAGNFSHRHDTSAGNFSSPAQHTNFSLPHDKAPATPDSADAAEGRFTASFCRFTDRADSPLPEQPCSIWDFSYLCTLPSHEPHFSSP